MKNRAGGYTLKQATCVLVFEAFLSNCGGAVAGDPSSLDDELGTTDEALTASDGGVTQDAGAKVANGKACTADAGCRSGFCNPKTHLCRAPTAKDGFRNGTETDVDCGGAATNPRCAAGKTCATATDCGSAACGAATSEFAGKCLVAKSCGGGRGANNTCGLTHTDSCCASLPAPGGSYMRYQNPDLPATVSPFKLDKFEVTVGRVRTFLAAFGGNLRGKLNLPPGAGAHPRIPGSGWRSSFNMRLPGSMAEANMRYTTACAYGGVTSQWGAPTWTNAAGTNDDKPINCIDWYTLFALCAWEGARLPTDAEWGFAAMGGDENRTFAWGNSEPYYPMDIGLVNAGIADPAWGYDLKFTVGGPYATRTDGAKHISAVGTHTGNGKWGHADLSGSMLELMLDSGELVQGECVDCANIDWPDPPQVAGYPVEWAVMDGNDTWSNGATQPDGGRILRGGSWHPDHPVGNYYNFGNYPVWRTYFAAGGRCARD